MTPSRRPSLRSLLVSGVTVVAFDDAFGMAGREIFDAELDDLALLHRDPRAERSRLVTRHHLASAVARWWDRDDPQILRAQIILSLFRDMHDAKLAMADGWSELLAGGASFESLDGHRIAVIRESRIGEADVVHAATVATTASVAVTITTSSIDGGEALRRCACLARDQIKLLEKS